jgi:hypothetical protein
MKVSSAGMTEVLEVRTGKSPAIGRHWTAAGADKAWIRAD